jgi:hypothetical protein
MMYILAPILTSPETTSGPQKNRQSVSATEMCPVPLTAGEARTVFAPGHATYSVASRLME